MKITDALRTSDELIVQLRLQAMAANSGDNRALHLLLRQLTESAVKINQVLNELSEVEL